MSLPGSEKRRKAVLFIHGFIGNNKIFSFMRSTADEAGYDSIFLTLPGHGGNLTDFIKAGRRDWSEAVRRKLAELRGKYQTVVVAGHSMGGLLSIVEAVRDPESVDAIFALSLPLYISLEASGFKTRAAALRRERADDSPGVKAAREMSGVSGITPLGTLLMLPNTIGLFLISAEARKKLPSLKTPIVAVNSAGDDVVSARSFSFIEKAALSEAPVKLYRLQKSGHFLYLPEEQKLINNEFVKLLKKL